jgi:hypothetical protein
VRLPGAAATIYHLITPDVEKADDAIVNESGHQTLRVICPVGARDKSRDCRSYCLVTSDCNVSFADHLPPLGESRLALCCDFTGLHLAEPSLHIGPLRV